MVQWFCCESVMIGQTTLLTELARVVKRLRADGASAFAHAGTRRVFRFAHEAIHQDLTQESIGVTIKVILKGRVGIASTETWTPASLARCVRSARAIATLSPPLKDLPALPRGHRLRTTDDYVPATVRISPAACVASLTHLFRLCKGAGAQLAGSLITAADEYAVVNSEGVSSYAASTTCGAKLVTMYRKLSGFASGVHRDVRALNLEELLARSLKQSLHRQEPATIPIGTYEVILEPEAVAELVEWLGYTAFGAKQVEERTSFLAGRMGDRVMDAQVTIIDDGNNPQSLRLPFDCEGTPRQPVTLIERGVASGIVYDTAYGARFGHVSTGHAVSTDTNEGPMPIHLAMAPGRTTMPAMIRTCQRGLLIPRFHYVNGLLNPRAALMTGLTREGAFLIEDGKLSRPVTTLRFTQSILEAFSRVLGISKERRLIADPSAGLGCALMPAMHLAAFAFTGRSE